MTGYLQVWRDRLQILRPQNGLMAAAGVLTGLAMLDPSPGTPLTVWTAAPLAAFLVTSFGNILNDVVDVKVDRTAHPERPLAAGRLSARDVLPFAIILLVLGLWEAFLAGGTPLALFAAANAGLLVLYERWAKRRGLVGNLLVGVLVASTFLFGAWAATGGPDGSWRLVLLLATMAFLTTVAREIFKDVQDMDGDLGRRTLPQAVGAPKARTAGAALTTAAVAISLAVFHPSLYPLHAAWPRFWLLLLLLADLDFLVAGFAAPYNIAYAQLLLKLGMVFSLAAFLSGPLLAP